MITKLHVAARNLVDTFRRDEAQGLRSRDRQFTIEVLSPYLEDDGWCYDMGKAPRDGTPLLLWDDRRGLAVSGRWHSDPGIDTPDAREPAWAWWVSDDDLVMWDGGPDDQPMCWKLLDKPGMNKQHSSPSPSPQSREGWPSEHDGCCEEYRLNAPAEKCDNCPRTDACSASKEGAR